MRIICIILFLGISWTASSQFGLRLKYNTDDYSNLTQYFEQSEFASPFGSSLEIGVDYWKRLKNYRLEFNPEISYSRSRSFTDALDVLNLDRSAFNFYLNTNIYAFDFAEDCDCPTFSKDGNFLTKGFHFIISPGVTYNMYSSNQSEIAQNVFSYSLGLGIGLDMGVTDLMTLTPFIMYRRGIDQNWKNLTDYLQVNPFDFRLSQFQFGVRVGFRADYVRNNRFR